MSAPMKIIALVFVLMAICKPSLCSVDEVALFSNPIATEQQQHLKRSLCNTYSGCGESADETSYEKQQFKRSLCNTFGGCGSKRSLREPRMEPSFLMKGLDAKDEKNDLVDVERLQWPSTPLSLQRQQQIANVRPELIAEILNDLIDYLKTSESYKSGKYIVMVPK